MILDWTVSLMPEWWTSDSWSAGAIMKQLVSSILISFKYDLFGNIFDDFIDAWLLSAVILIRKRDFVPDSVYAV